MIQWPLVVDRLLVLLPSLTGWGQVSVFDGAAIDSQSASYCTVGHATDGVTTRSGTFSTSISPDGFRQVEQGHVACTLTATSDLQLMAPVRSTVFGLFNALDQAIRDDRTLGVLSPEGVAGLDADLSALQVVGSGLTTAFNITYYTIT